MKTAYLILAIVGAVVPFMFFLGVFHDEVVPLTGFLPTLFANGVAGGFAADLVITSLVFWIYMFAAKDGPTPWPFIVMNLFVGLSLALPAYLYWREARGDPVPA